MVENGLMQTKITQCTEEFKNNKFLLTVYVVRPLIWHDRWLQSESTNKNIRL